MFGDYFYVVKSSINDNSFFCYLIVYTIIFFRIKNIEKVILDRIGD